MSLMFYDRNQKLELIQSGWNISVQSIKFEYAENLPCLIIQVVEKYDSHGVRIENNDEDFMHLG